MTRQDHEGARLARMIAERPTASSKLADDVRERAIAHTRRRLKEGASQALVARELAVTTTTVRRWLSMATMTPSPKASAKKLKRVRVVDAGATLRDAVLVLTTPRGLRVEGLDLEAVCALITRCG